MKYLFLAALICLLFVPHARAQFDTGSLFVELWKSGPGEVPAFELKEFPANRLDATGDGLSEIITVEDDQSGVPVQMRVWDFSASKEVMTIDLDLVRERLIEDGFSSDEVRDLRFLSFYRGAREGLSWVILEANRVPGDTPSIEAPTKSTVVLYFDQADPLFRGVVGLRDVTISSIYDFNGDGFMDVNVTTKLATVILTSVHAAGN